MVALCGSVFLLAACEEVRQQHQPDPRASEQPEKYARDRDLCRAQVDEYMKQRRVVEDVNRGTGDLPETLGQRGLATERANYSDTRTADKEMASCMEQRGWPQPKPPWWQRQGFGI